MRPPLTLRELATRTNGLRLGLVGAATAAFVGWHIYAKDYLLEVYHGPQPITLTQLQSMDPVDHMRWFNVTGEVRPGHLLKTTTTRRRGGTSVTNHFALIKSKAVIVETSSDSLPPKFLAWASTFDESGSIFSRARKQLDTWTSAGPKIPLAPILLTTSSDVAFTQNGHAIASGAVALGLLWFAISAVRKLLNYMRSAPIAALRKSVRAPEGIPNLVAEIDQQLAARDPNARRTGLVLLPSWLLNVNQNSFAMMSDRDLIWAVPYSIKKKLYGVITTSSSDVVMLVDRNGEKFDFKIPEADIRDFLIAIYRWAPWAVVGTDADMEARFGKNGRKGFARFKKTPSKTELIKGVDDRRAQIHAEWAANAGAQAAAAAAAPPASPAHPVV
jgi:hypothetical protein